MRSGSSSEGHARGALVDVRGQVAQEPPHLAEEVVLVLGDIVDDAALGVNVGAAEFVLGEADAKGALHQRRTADHHLGRVARHDREVRRDQTPGRETGDRAGGHGHHGNLAHGIGDDPEARRRVDRFASGPAAPATALDAAAAPFQGTHQRHLVLHGEVFGVDALAQSGRVRRAALQGEVLAADHHPTALYATETDDVVGRDEARQFVVVVVVGDGRGLALLLERARIEQGVDPFADGQPAAGVLLGDAVLAALKFGQSTTAVISRTSSSQLMVKRFLPAQVSMTAMT